MGLADLIEQMAADGAPLASIVRAVRAIEERDEAEKARRAKVAERKRQQRAREAEAVTVTGQSQDSHGTVVVLPVPAPAFPPDPPITPTHTPEKETPRARAARLPVDWQPEPLSGEVERIVSLWPPGLLESQLARFRDYWSGVGGDKGRKADWDATWRNWLRKVHDDRSSRRSTDRPSTGRGRSLADWVADQHANRATRVG